jgi:hypothetical protein
MPSDVLEVTSCFMRSPIRILVKKEELTLEGILHIVYFEISGCVSVVTPLEVLELLLGKSLSQTWSL